jgi:transcriptional regulator with XRE-family HTH domain
VNNVRVLRERFDMTQDEFAEFCGVSRISIARYDTGEPISRKNAQKIALACHVSIDYVIGQEEKPATEEDMAWTIRERLRRDPSYRLLFDAADAATPEHLRAAAVMLKALEDKNGDAD